MTVYVLTRNFSFEGFDAPLGVFSTEEKAYTYMDLYKEKFPEDNEFYEYVVWTYELDDQDFT